MWRPARLPVRYTPALIPALAPALAPTLTPTLLPSPQPSPATQVRGASPASFQLDAVLEAGANQQTTYSHTVAHLLPRLLAGRRCAAIFLGQPASGKTHTAYGTPQMLDDFRSCAAPRARTPHSHPRPYPRPHPRPHPCPHPHPHPHLINRTRTLTVGVPTTHGALCLS